MRHLLLLPILALELGAAKPPTHNFGWQYTRWGMTPGEVIDASKGTAKPADKGQGYPNEYELAEGTFATPARSFHTQFYFAAGKLSHVYLKLDDNNQCDGIHTDMLSIFGKPIARDASGSSISWDWIDGPSGNHIRLICGYISMLQYGPIPSREGAGL